MINTFLVGTGGFLGACSRYLLSKIINKYWKKSFPMATFIINVLGSFILGFIFTHPNLVRNLHNEIKYVLGIGFFGAFTTFSTFEFEVLQLVENDKLTAAGLYVLLSFLIGFFLAWISSHFLL